MAMTALMASWMGLGRDWGLLVMLLGFLPLQHSHTSKYLLRLPGNDMEKVPKAKSHCDLPNSIHHHSLHLTSVASIS